MTILFALGLNAKSTAQIRFSDSQSPVLNYAFAAQLGSGIYHVNGRTVQVYRLGLTKALYTPKDAAWLLRLGLPLTFGFHDFKMKDVINGALPHTLANLALVPTLELLFPVFEHWHTGPFIGLGGGQDFANHIFNYIFAVGLKTFALLPRENFDIRIGVRAVYSGFTTKSADFVDDFGMIESGVDFRRLLNVRLFGAELDGGLFGVNYIYLWSPHLMSPYAKAHVLAEWEAGLSIGTHKPVRILGIALPRVGISYKNGIDETVRIIVGNPFPMGPPRDAGPEMQ